MSIASSPPVSNRWAQSLVNSATNANITPTAIASSTARRLPMVRAAPAMHKTISGTHTAPTTNQAVAVGWK